MLSPFRLLAVCLTLACLVLQASPLQARPRLIVQVTVDQLRGDLPLRYYDRLSTGGLRLFLDGGVAYTNAHYRHSATMTGVGHATLFTGADPVHHGIIGNDWRDRATGKGVNCVSDEEFGRSPRNLFCTTIGDELHLATAGASRVFGVSLKDRGAILPAGFKGKAFWYGGDGRFISSAYYYPDALPAWAEAFNDSDAMARYVASGAWDLLRPRDEYVFKDRDDQPWEASPQPSGHTFPHPLGDEPRASYSPFNDALTLDFARAIIEGENLGAGPATDLLGVSLSMTDSIGHTYGPDSLEAEDNLLRLDLALAAFFAYLDQRFGLEHVAIALSADHGVCPAPGYLRSLGLPTGAAITGEQVRQLNAGMIADYDTTQALIADFSANCFHLDRAALANAGLELNDVALDLASRVREIEGVAFAFARPDLLRGNVPADPIAQMGLRSFSPQRSGDVLVLLQPGWMYGGIGQGTTHGSPWAYDTHIPVYFAGAGIKPQRVTRRVTPNDIAPTWAAMLGTNPPSASIGTPLPEVLGQN